MIKTTKIRDISYVRNIDEISDLLSWLYKKEENFVIIENIIGTNLKIRIDEDFNFKVSTLEEHSTERIEVFDIEELITIIDQVKNQNPPKNTQFTSMWGYIKTDISSLRALSKNIKNRSRN